MLKTKHELMQTRGVVGRGAYKVVRRKKGRPRQRTRRATVVRFKKNPKSLKVVAVPLQSRPRKSKGVVRRFLERTCMALVAGAVGAGGAVLGRKAGNYV